MSVSKLSKVLTHIDKFLSPDHLDKLSFLAETVVSIGIIEDADSIHKIQREIENHQGITKKRSVVLLKKFLEVIGYVKFGKELDPVIQALDGSCSLLSPKKLYLYEICIIVCDELGKRSFSQLLYRIPDEELGGHRDRIKTPVQLFRRLLRQQTLSVDKEEESIELLCDWLVDIGRLDIKKDVEKHARPLPEQGMCRVQRSYDAVCLAKHPSVSGPGLADTGGQVPLQISCDMSLSPLLFE